MRRKEKEIADINEIEEIIKKARICRIGLVDGDEPYIVPVCFGYEKNAFYFHCAPEGRKIEIIKKNNQVCVEIDTDVEIISAEKPCNWSTKYRSVIGVGRAHILENEEKIHGLNVIMKHYAEDTNAPELEKLDAACVIKIDIESMTGKKSGYQ